MNSLPPYFNTGLFNTSAFYTEKDYLTKEEADKLYLSVNISGNFEAIIGVTNGIGQEDKALILDSSRNINNINILSAQNIDVDNTNTTPFSLTANSDLYGLHLHSNFTGTGQNYGSAISFNHSNSNQIPLSAIVLDKKATATGDLVFYTRNGSATLQESMRLKSNGNLGLGINNPLYQLDLGGFGTGINTGSLKFNDITFNQDLYLNIIEGGATASKAVVLNSNKDYSGINDLSITGNFIASTSIATPLITTTDINLSGSLSGGTISTNSIALTPSTKTINSFTVDGVLWYSNSSRHFATRQVGSDYISLLSYSAGGAFNDYITWLHNSGSPLLSFDCSNLSVPNSILANNLRIQDSIDDTRFISCLDNSMASGGTKAITLGRFNTINQQAEISYKYSSTIGNSVLNLGHHTNNVQVSIADNGRIAFGGNADTLTGSRVYSIGSTAFVNGSYQTIHEFRTANNANKMLIEMNPAGDSFIGTSTANKFCFMYNRGRRMTIDNELTTSDNPINITGDYTFTINTGGGLYSRMNTANSSYSNSGSVTSSQWSLICIGFINCSQIYMTSDRRMKENIEILNEDYVDNLYNQNIYSYNYKGKTNKNIGFIAQDLLKDGYIDLLAFTPNKDLKIEDEYDIEGTQMNLNYNEISICNSMMIKKLIKRINILEEKLNRNNIL